MGDHQQPIHDPALMSTPAWFTDELEGILLGVGYRMEPVGDASDSGKIVNVLAANGDYLYTLTISVTP